MLKNTLGLFIAAMLLLGCIGSSGTKYENSAKGFSTIQPIGWNVKDDGSRTVFYPGLSGVEIAIVSVQSNATITSDDLFPKLVGTAEQSISMLPSIGYLKKTEDTDTVLTVDGQRANQKSLAYEYTINGTKTTSHNRMVFFRDGNRYFMMVFAAAIVDTQQSGQTDAVRAAYEKAFDDVLSNFRAL